MPPPPTNFTKGNLHCNPRPSAEKTATFHNTTTDFFAKWRLRNECRNSILMMCHAPNMGSASDCRVCTPFWTKNSWTFQGHFSHFWRTPFSAKKSLESVFFGSSTTWVILSQRSFCVCSFSLEFYLSYKFSIKIQGLSSTDCNFQGLSRCVRTLWLVMPHGQFASTNQKHHSDLGSHASSVWNFCARFTDVISRGKQWRHCKTSTVFSCYQQPQRNSIYFVT